MRSPLECATRHRSLRSLRAAWRALAVIGAFAVLTLGAGPPAHAGSTDATLDEVMNADSPVLPGVSAEVRGSGEGYYGDSLRVTFDNTTGTTYRVAVPVGLRFKPRNGAVQTMLTAGNETIVVPPGKSATLLKAFCGESQDAPPGTDDVFSPDGKASGGTLDALKKASAEGRHDATDQDDVWDAIAMGDDSDSDSDARKAGAIGVVATGVTGGAAVAVSRRRNGGGSGAASRPLAGDDAIARLIETGHETVEIGGKKYVLPPESLRAGVDGIAYETKQVDGHVVVDRDHVAIVPHAPDAPAIDVVDTVQPPVESKPAADDTAKKPTKPEVKLSEAEKHQIIDWGVKNNRTPEDIQRDLDAQNETAGGNGAVPVTAPPVRVKLGEGSLGGWYAGEEVTLSAEEAERYLKAKKDLADRAPQIKNLRRELTWARIQVREWMAAQISPESRWAAGMWELIKRGNRVDNPARYLAKLNDAKSVEDLLVTKYGKPTWREYWGTGRSYENAVQAWRNGPKGLEFAEHCGNIRSQAIRDIQSMTSPDAKGATSWFNRPKKHLDAMGRYQEQIIESLKDLQSRQRALTDMERSFAERIRTGPVRE